MANYASFHDIALRFGTFAFVKSLVELHRGGKGDYTKARSSKVFDKSHELLVPLAGTHLIIH